MVAAAMELKRLGLARKPLFVVPNHMLGQFSSELLMLGVGELKRLRKERRPAH